MGGIIMGKLIEEDFNVGDYIYYSDEDGYHVCKIKEIAEYEPEFWGHWSAKPVKILPKTIEEFNAIEKNEECEFIDMHDVDGILSLEKLVIEVGNYVYYIVDGDYRVGRITKIINSPSDNPSDIGMYGLWSKHLVKQLPKTVAEFNAMDKFGNNSKRVNLDFPFKILKLEGIGTTVNVNLLDFLNEFIDIANYESSTIMSLNEILGEGYDIEDVLKILISDISKITQGKIV